jgi:hypothetical protein
MNNNSPPTLIAISDLIHSHLALLQQQLESSSTPHLTRLLQAQFHATSPELSPHSKATPLNRLRFLTSHQHHHHRSTPTHLPPDLTPQPPNQTASQPLKFYAVRRGRTCNTIFTTREECKPHVHQFSGTEFKSFRTYTDAQAYLSPNACNPTNRLPPNMTTTTMKIYDIQPTLDNPSLSRIRFPAWLKCLYNISQMELTTLDPLGAFYLVALDEDWDIHPENLNQQNQVRPRPLFAQPPMYAANAAGAAIASYNIKAAQFEYQQRVRADLHSVISRSLGSVTLRSINSNEISIWHRIPLPSRPRT